MALPHAPPIQSRGQFAHHASQAGLPGPGLAPAPRTSPGAWRYQKKDGGRALRARPQGSQLLPRPAPAGAVWREPGPTPLRQLSSLQPVPSVIVGAGDKADCTARKAVVVVMFPIAESDRGGCLCPLRSWFTKDHWGDRIFKRVVGEPTTNPARTPFEVSGYSPRQSAARRPTIAASPGELVQLRRSTASA